MNLMRSLIVFCLLMLTTAIYPQTINSEFRLGQDITQIKEGDILEATMRIWPLENADLVQFQKLEKTLFFNSLFLNQIVSLDVSPNNADVVELKGVFIATAAAIQPVQYLRYNDIAIELRPGTIQIEKLSNQGKDFYIMEQSLTASRLWMVVWALITILIIAAIIKRRALRDFILNLRPDEKKKAKNKYDELFRLANRREDFEKLYHEKSHWLSLLESVAPAHREFLKTINQHQFKKDWGNEEFSEVRASFDIIRRSFEKK